MSAGASVLTFIPSSTARRRERQELAQVTSIVRPKTRGDCEPGGSNAARPCPWVSCRYHLYFDLRRNGRPGRPRAARVPELEELEETCALDLAAHGGMSHEEVGEALYLSGTRIEQVEKRALRRLPILLEDDR